MMQYRHGGMGVGSAAWVYRVRYIFFPSHLTGHKSNDVSSASVPGRHLFRKYNEQTVGDANKSHEVIPWVTDHHPPWLPT